MCLIVLVAFVLFFAGCDKKKIDQVGEMTPPGQQEQIKEKEISTTPPKEGELNMPGAEAPVQVASKDGSEGSSLKGDAAVFENKDIHFDYDRFSIKPEDRKILAEKASYLNSHQDVKIRIEGHCDERGTTEYNLALGERRAKAAQEYLVFLGISPSRISTISYGEERPLDTSGTEEAWANNRRAHFVILEK